MVMEGFSERRGARAESDDVARVAIVITDGRSQDNVTEPAIAARRLHVNMFAIGVTDHVLASELESIAGSPSRWFYVDRFKDLDTRLRSLIQKAACPSPEPKPRPSSGCNAAAQTGCDRSLNEICLEVSSDLCFFLYKNFLYLSYKTLSLNFYNIYLYSLLPDLFNERLWRRWDCNGLQYYH